MFLCEMMKWMGNFFLIVSSVRNKQTELAMNWQLLYLGDGCLGVYYTIVSTILYVWIFLS